MIVPFVIQTGGAGMTTLALYLAGARPYRVVRLAQSRRRPPYAAASSAPRSRTPSSPPTCCGNCSHANSPLTPECNAMDSRKALVPQKPEEQAHLLANGLTRVELTWIERRVEHWIRFGHPAERKALDRRRTIATFLPGSIFAFVRWGANDHGTLISRIDIVRTITPDEPYQTLPFVRPGGEILLKIESWPKVQSILQVIDAIEAQGIDPADIASDYWRHVHHRVTAGEAPRAYTRAQHGAWIKRREVQP